MSRRTQMLKKGITSRATVIRQFETTGDFKCQTYAVPEMRRELGVCLERARLITESYKATEGEPLVIRRAKALAYILRNMTVYIQDGELIVGNAASQPGKVQLYPELSVKWLKKAFNLGYRHMLDDKQRREWQGIARYWAGQTISDRTLAVLPKRLLGYVYWNGAGWTHNFDAGKPVEIPNMEKVLRLGLNGIAAKVRKRLKELDAQTLPVKEYVEQRRNLEANLIALEVAVAFAERYAAKARELASVEGDEKRRGELEKIAEVCDRVPGNPARTLHEAIQSFYLCSLISKQIEVCGQGAGNRFDVLMNPYYQSDKREGRITRGEAQELLECLYIKFNDWGYLRPPDAAQIGGGAPSLKDLTIGGVTREGDDATNELSFIMLDAARSIQTPEPSIALRYHPKVSPELISKAIDVVRSGVGYPAFYNDSVIVPWLLSRGIPLEEARDYGIPTCVWPAIQGKNSRSWRPCIGSISLGKCLELALYQGRDKDIYTGKQLGDRTPDPRTFASIEDVMAAFLAQVRFFAERLAAIDHIHQVTYEQYLQRPFGSALIDGCIEQGKDCSSWEYNGLSNVLMAGSTNVSNSLAAIKKFIFDDKVITMEELVEACRTNFEGKEELRQRLLNEAPKFGNDHDYVDLLAREVHTRANAEFMKFKSNAGYPYILDGSIVSGYFGVSKACGALPDGKRDGEPFADAVASPAAGTDKKGPTAVLKSVSKVTPTYPLLLNQKFLPQYLEEENKKVFAEYLKAWADLGIYHIQFNVVGKDILLDAQAHPEKHTDLVVRVAGYSAYFIDLSKAVQDDIIRRVAQTF